MKRRNILFIFFIIFLCLILVNTFFQSRKEFKSDVNFIVRTVNFSPTKSLVLYNDSSDFNFWIFSLRDSDSVKVGDSISKTKCSEHLQVYREDSLKNFQLHFEVKETSLFSISWY